MSIRKIKRVHDARRSKAWTFYPFIRIRDFVFRYSHYVEGEIGRVERVRFIESEMI